MKYRGGGNYVITITDTKKEDYDYIIRGENFKKAIDFKESKILSHFSDSEYKEELKKKLHISVLPDYRNNNFYFGCLLK